MNVRLVLLVVLVFVVSLPSFGQLNGTFVVGPSVGTDYPTLTAMVADLDGVGISGNVVFEIENGIYAEQVKLDGTSIVGSGTFSITIRGQNSDRSLVILTFDNNTVSNDHTIELEGIDNVIIEHITLQSTTPGTTNKVMDIFDSKFITIDHCRLIGVEATTISSNQACLTVENNSEDVNVSNTRFDDGSFGIRFSNSTNSIFSNNEFRNQHFEGITISTASDITMESNFITNDLNASSQYKAFNINLTNDFVVNRNRVVINSGLFGILLQSTQAVANPSNLVTNNHIHINSTSATEGVIFFGADKVDFVNNTVIVSGGHANLNLDIVTNSNIFNNVLLNFNDENVYEGGSLSADFVTADFNNVYSSGSVTPDDQLLNEHTARTGLDANSVSINITFADPSFPNVCHYGLNGAATVWPGVTLDIDGTARDTTTPDIGAFEFTLPTPVIFASNNISICAGDQVVLQPQINFVSYLWPDGSTESSILADADSTYVVEVIDAAGCVLTASVDVDMESVSVDLGDDLILCSGSAFTLDAGSGFNTYLWSTGETSQQIEATTAGTYSVTITSAIGCTASDELVITLSDDVLTPNFLVSGVGCPADEIQFIEFSDTVPESISWDFGDGSSSSDPNPAHTYSALGNYEVTMTASIGDCSYSITKPVEITYECPWWLEAHYPLDTAANDLSTNERNGTIMGEISFVNDPLRGQVASFGEAQQDVIDLGFSYNPADNNNEMTVSFWMKTDGWKNQGAVLINTGWTEGWYVSKLWQTDAVLFYTNTPEEQWTHAGVVNDNQWHHVVSKIGDGQKSFYIDGKNIYNVSIGGEVGKSDLNVLLGGAYGGLMDDVKIWNTALSEEQIGEEYLKTRSPLLLAYYPLDEDASDQGGNQYDGVPFNGGPTYVTDMERGKVALFNKEGFIGAVFDAPVTETTVSFWFKTDATDDNMEMYKVVEEIDDSGSSDQVLSLNEGKAQHFLSGQFSTSTTDYRDGQWHYISLSMGASVNGQRLRVDGGEQVAFGNLRASTLLDRKGINIGNTFAGYIDDVKIWSKTLSVVETIKDYESNNKQGLLAHYSFDDNAEDISGQGNHGTVVNDVTFVEDQIRGTVASFDGVDDYIDIPELEPQKEVTVSAWFKQAGTNQMTIINYSLWGYSIKITEGTNHFLTRVSTGVPGSADFNALTDGQGSIDDGQWHQITLTYDGVQHLYFDGQLVAELTPPTPRDIYYGNNTSDLTIGKGKIANEDYDGLLDDVTIWDRALSANEILAKYEAENSGTGYAGGRVLVVEEQLSLNVYPNPSSGIINYELKGPELVGDGILYIYDKTGLTLYSKDIMVGDEVIGQIDLTRFNNGLYIIMVDSQQGKVSKNFIIRH